ncbi:putative pectinesterase/pectinesterase inhibitor 45 [Ananas comosus]|uniref:Pectinesterase n=1 Tax=Ananas comosus TaxID=4615 RepID=A0A199W391_ANACO|nr:putative pectinesterase/pectinesterase inhibitor 45 [Ananas comosus]
MSSDPRTADAVLFLLTNISIDHALANAFGTYAAVKKMYDAAMMACLLSCETEYYLAVSHLQSAIQYLAEKNYFDGISALQSAFDDVTTCEDTFNEPRFQPVKSPLIQKNQIAKYLCNISFEFERLLEPKHMNQRKSSNLVSFNYHGHHACLLASLSSQHASGTTIFAPNSTVANDGNGNFTTISAAVQAAPSFSSEKYVIYIKAGVYQENVIVDVTKKNIVLLGDGADKTMISSNRSVDGGVPTDHTGTLEFKIGINLDCTI